MGTNGEVLASHVSAFTSAGTESGGASISASPDRRWLAFLDWTSPELLEVYLYDLQSGETRAVGPSLTLSDNRELVIMPPADYISSWRMYDFVAKRLVELQGTEGATCCWRSLLQ